MKLSDFKTLFSDRFLSLFEIQYIDRDGQPNTWQLVSREQTGPKCFTGRLQSADAVVIVPYHRERKQLVVIREFRIALGGFQYGFPAGLVDPGESVEMAVRRELMEETGLTVVRHQRTSPVVFSSSGITDESIIIAHVVCVGEPSDAGNRASEQIETLFVGKSDAERLCRDDTILMDVKTWLVLSGFAAGGLGG
jgi:ADP-ribose pyrophosphatase